LFFCLPFQLEGTTDRSCRDFATFLRPTPQGNAAFVRREARPKSAVSNFALRISIKLLEAAD
jgi:hypothetical protein